MTVAVPLKHQLNHTELRFCLRSVEKFTHNLQVIIIGDNLPDWINNVTQIKVKDINSRKQKTIKYKAFAALNYADEVLWLHDDTYLLEPYTPRYYFHGDLSSNNEGGARILKQELKEMGKLTLNFDAHCPIVYDRRFLDVLEKFTSDTVVKSMYGNYLSLPCMQVPDPKIDTKFTAAQVKQFIKGKAYFQTGEKGLNSCLPILEELFPDPSRFEI